MKTSILITISVLMLSLQSQALTNKEKTNIKKYCAEMTAEARSNKKDIADLRELISEINSDLGNKLNRCKKASGIYNDCVAAAHALSIRGDLKDNRWPAPELAACKRAYNSRLKGLGKNGSADCKDFVKFKKKVNEAKSFRTNINKALKKAARAYPKLCKQ